MFLLAKDYQGTDPTGWWMSEKLDGVRARYLPVTRSFISRNNKPIYTPDWFTLNFPDLALDGELFIDRGRFQETVSVVRKGRPVDQEWVKIFYHVFDQPEHPGRWEERLASLFSLTARRIVPVVHYRCESPEHLAEFHQSILAKKGEGVMLRQPGTLYHGKRSSTLLKVKTFDQSLAEVREYLPGKGKHEGRMGALLCHWKNGYPLIPIGGGFSDKERENPPPIGSVILFKHFGVTNDGLPRFPIKIG